MSDTLPSRVWGGLGSTLLVQLWLAACASAVAASAGLALDGRVVALVDLRSAVEAVALEPHLLGTWAAIGAAVLAAHLLALPALQLAWLYALAHGQPAGDSLRFGITHYGAALRQSLVVALSALAGGALLALLPLWMEQRVSEAPESKQVLALGLCTLPVVLWGLCCHVWHDLARAQLAAHGSLTWRGLFAECFQAVRPSRFGGFALYLVFALPLCALAPLTYATRRDLLALALAQGILLARGVLRSVWLARAAQLAHARGPR